MAQRAYPLECNNPPAAFESGWRYHMRNPKVRVFTPFFLLILLIVVIGSVRAQTQPSAADDLAGTSWQLVKFQGGDGKTLTPDDKSKYTIVFERDGRVSALLDCNRGRGT